MKAGKLGKRFKRGDRVRMTAKQKRFISRQYEKVGMRKGTRWPYDRVGTVEGDGRLGRKYVSVRFPGTNGPIDCLPEELEESM